MSDKKGFLLGIIVSLILFFSYSAAAVWMTSPESLKYPNPGVHPGMIGPGTFNNTNDPSAFWKFPARVILGGILDMQNNRVENVASPISNADAVTKEYVDAAYASATSTSGSVYVYARIYAACTSCSCTDCSSYCNPGIPGVSSCPAGYTELFYADRNTAFSSTGLIYTDPPTVIDSSLYCSDSASARDTASCTADVKDSYGNIIAVASPSKSDAASDGAKVVASCAYRICTA